jgi:hypothetical protein
MRSAGPVTLAKLRMTFSSLTPQLLRRAADIQEEIQSLRKQLLEILGNHIATPAATASEIPRKGRKRKLSADGLAIIRAGVAKRMAKTAVTASAPAEKRKRKTSIALRKARSEMMKAGWAARRASGNLKSLGDDYEIECLAVIWWSFLGLQLRSRIAFSHTASITKVSLPHSQRVYSSKVAYRSR